MLDRKLPSLDARCCRTLPGGSGTPSSCGKTARRHHLSGLGAHHAGGSGSDRGLRTTSHPPFGSARGCVRGRRDEYDPPSSTRAEVHALRPAHRADRHGRVRHADILPGPREVEASSAGSRTSCPAGGDRPRRDCEVTRAVTPGAGTGDGYGCRGACVPPTCRTGPRASPSAILREAMHGLMSPCASPAVQRQERAGGAAAAAEQGLTGTRLRGACHFRGVSGGRGAGRGGRVVVLDDFAHHPRRSRERCRRCAAYTGRGFVGDGAAMWSLRRNVFQDGSPGAGPRATRRSGRSVRADGCRRRSVSIPSGSSGTGLAGAIRTLPPGSDANAAHLSLRGARRVWR